MSIRVFLYVLYCCCTAIANERLNQIIFWEAGLAAGNYKKNTQRLPGNTLQKDVMKVAHVSFYGMRHYRKFKRKHGGKWREQVLKAFYSTPYNRHLISCEVGRFVPGLSKSGQGLLWKLKAILKNSVDICISFFIKKEGKISMFFLIYASGNVHWIASQYAHGLDSAVNRRGGGGARHVSAETHVWSDRQYSSMII